MGRTRRKLREQGVKLARTTYPRCLVKLALREGCYQTLRFYVTPRIIYASTFEDRKIDINVGVVQYNATMLGRKLSRSQQ